LNTRPEISVERALLITESYRETEDEPTVIRRAKALRKTLSEMSIYILPEEIIVGNIAHKQRAAPIFPEYDVDYLRKEIDEFEKRPGDSFAISEDNKKRLTEILPYWKGKTVKETVYSMCPEETLKAGEGGFGYAGVGVADSTWEVENGDGHITVGYDKILKLGLRGILKEAKEHLSTIDLTDPENIPKYHFLKAVTIALESSIGFAKRYSRLPRQMAQETIDPGRREELERIAEVCDWVPENPARTFHEAVQSVWFVQLIIQIETNGHSISLGRFDQYMYRYFESDLKAGRLTREQALELVECFYLKLNSVNKLRSWDGTQFLAGYPMFQNLTVGGQTRDARDATNELSYICLEAMANLKLPQPSMSARIHRKTPERFLKKCVDVIKLGIGMPALFNDDIIIPAMLHNTKVSIEDAFDYGIVGCVEPSVMGKWGGRHAGCLFNLVKCMELTLYNGTDPRTGYNLCPGDGDLTTFKSVEDLLNAFRKQVRYYVKQAVIKDNIIDTAYENVTPTPFLSALVDECIKRGKDLKQGGAIYDCTAISTGGIATIANSCAAIAKVVLEDKTITAQQLRHALETNFEDMNTKPAGEQIRRILRNAPKYGNDVPFVDLIAKEVAYVFMTEVPKYKTTRHGRGPIGCVFLPDWASVSSNIPWGFVIGATPDGRKAGEPVSDVESADMGTDTNGPTALVKSVANIDHILLSDGAIFNLRFTPSLFEDENKVSKFMALVRTYFSLGGMQMQFNVVSTETLRGAQEHPEKYRDLMVRVAGYTAPFVSLDRAVQDAIIARMEHSLA